MKILYITLGFLSVSVGAVGAVLPVLPTTPFLLLGSYFLAKGSDKFNDWLKGTKLYKNNMESFEKERAMTIKTKAYLMTLSSTMIWISIFTVDRLPLKIMLIVIYMFKFYYFIFKIDTKKEDKKGDKHE